MKSSFWLIKFLGQSFSDFLLFWGDGGNGTYALIAILLNCHQVTFSPQEEEEKQKV